MSSIIFILIAIPFLIYLIFANLRKGVSTKTKLVEGLLVTFYILSLLLFLFGYSLNSADYYTAIDIVDGGYTPFATKHLLSLAIFFVLSIWAVFMLWLKADRLSPLVKVLSLVFLIIGIFMSIAIGIQISTQTDSQGMTIFFVPFIFSHFLVSLILLIKSFLKQASLASERTYKNKFLNYLNTQMAKTSTQPLWTVSLIAPVLFIVVGVLILFGQDYNSLVKVFTETTTWHFSQKTHPPFLDHRGHYLCTVAVCGDPKVVKPLRLGKRHGHEIVVNRQLLIANAFEELIQDISPRLHQIIRSGYDKYGYPLSTKITSPQQSNLVYKLMKPLEYFFLVVLYLCCIKPEEKINKQYTI